MVTVWSGILSDKGDGPCRNSGTMDGMYRSKKFLVRVTENEVPRKDWRKPIQSTERTRGPRDPELKGT